MTLESELFKSKTGCRLYELLTLDLFFLGSFFDFTKMSGDSLQVCAMGYIVATSIGPTRITDMEPFDAQNYMTTPVRW